MRAVVAKWLARPFYELTTMPTPTAVVAPNDVDRSRMSDPGVFKTTIAFPPVTRTTLANGMTLVVARRTGVGMVDLSLQFATGTLADDRAAAAFDLLGGGGTPPGDEPVARRLSQLGGRMSSQANAWRSGVDWSVTGDRLDASVALIADMVRRPSYPKTAVDERNGAMAQRLDVYARNPLAAGTDILKRAIWGAADPRGRLPSPQDVRATAPQTLADFHARHIVPEAATLYVVGDVDPQRVQALAERAFAGWKRSAAPGAAPSLPAQPPAPPGPRLILIDAPGAAQSSITVGAVAPPFDPATSATETLVGAVVADIGAGRLNRNLRQDKGWTYGFGGGIDDAPAGDRLLVASGTVQADRTAASLAELRREFAEVATTRPLTKAELDGQRTAMTRAAAQRFARNDAFRDALVTAGTYGTPPDRAATSERRLGAVTLDQAQAFAATLFDPGRLTWVVIGDRKTIEPQVRALGIASLEVWDIHGRPLR